MERALFKYLESWLIDTYRKPLVIRGARQVGKTWLVRHFAKMAGKQLIEINFEKQATAIKIFASNEGQQILLNLSMVTKCEVIPENSILFLDEIQASPEMFAKLRWLAEDLPQLPVIAAGSLLDFVLADHTFSMPVGRISYAYLEPLSFEEYLQANKRQILYDYLASYKLNAEVATVIHEQLMFLFKEYLLVGGMPAVVQSWVSEHSLDKVGQIQQNLLTTYRDDFAKYKGNIETERLDEVMTAIPKMLGKKFVFSQVNADVKAAAMKQVLNSLQKAKVVNRVRCSAANGVPLAAQIRGKYFKMIFLDVGLCGASLGLNLTEINDAGKIVIVNSGDMAEQVVGQLLRTINPPYIEPALYYWHRDESGSNAEIDYVIQHGGQVVPIEVKAGTTGTLKSLHLFMGLKKLSLAVRINSDVPSLTPVNLKDTLGNEVQYRLLSIPFYLIGQLHRLISEAK